MGMGKWNAWVAIVAITVGVSLARSAPANPALDRGAYLVNTLMACGVCHSPVDANGNPQGAALSGGPALTSPAFTAYPPNLTGDVRTGFGGWTKVQVIEALRNGRTPEGRVLHPPMPVAFYRALSDGDAAAVADYLKSLPATSRQVSPRPTGHPHRTTVPLSRPCPTSLATTSWLMVPMSPTWRTACSATPRSEPTAGATIAVASVQAALRSTACGGHGSPPTSRPTGTPASAAGRTPTSSAR